MRPCADPAGAEWPPRRRGEAPLRCCPLAASSIMLASFRGQPEVQAAKSEGVVEPWKQMTCPGWSSDWPPRWDIARTLAGPGSRTDAHYPCRMHAMQHFSHSLQYGSAHTVFVPGYVRSGIQKGPTITHAPAPPPLRTFRRTPNSSRTPTNPRPIHPHPHPQSEPPPSSVPHLRGRVHVQHKHVPQALVVSVQAAVQKQAAVGGGGGGEPAARARRLAAGLQRAPAASCRRGAVLHKAGAEVARAVVALGLGGRGVGAEIRILTTSTLLVADGRWQTVRVVQASVLTSPCIPPSPCWGVSWHKTVRQRHMHTPTRASRSPNTHRRAGGRGCCCARAHARASGRRGSCCRTRCCRGCCRESERCNIPYCHAQLVTPIW